MPTALSLALALLQDFPALWAIIQTAYTQLAGGETPAELQAAIDTAKAKALADESTAVADLTAAASQP